MLRSCAACVLLNYFLTLVVAMRRLPLPLGHETNASESTAVVAPSEPPQLVPFRFGAPLARRRVSLAPLPPRGGTRGRHTTRIARGARHKMLASCRIVQASHAAPRTARNAMRDALSAARTARSTRAGANNEVSQICSCARAQAGARACGPMDVQKIIASRRQRRLRGATGSDAKHVCSAGVEHRGRVNSGSRIWARARGRRACGRNHLRRAFF